MRLKTNLKLVAEKFYMAYFIDAQLDNKQFMSKVNELLTEFDVYEEKEILLNEVIRLGKSLIQSEEYLRKEVAYCNFTSYPSDN